MASKFQQRHYEAIAEAIRTARRRLAVDYLEFDMSDPDMSNSRSSAEAAINSVEHEFIQLFKVDNSHFKRDLFEKASAI